MTATVNQEVILAGFPLEIEATFDVAWTDNGIGSYEFWGSRGVHHNYGWEVGECESCEIATDLQEFITDELAARGNVLRNRRWFKQARQIRRAIRAAFERFDPANEFDMEAVCEAAGEP